jgi:hypothetical protein
VPKAHVPYGAHPRVMSTCPAWCSSTGDEHRTTLRSLSPAQFHFYSICPCIQFNALSMAPAGGIEPCSRLGNCAARCVPISEISVPIGCGVPSFIVSFASRPRKLVVWVEDRCSSMLPLVRNWHMSGNLVVCICRLRASCIELPNHTPLQFLPERSLCPRGAVGILCCVPKSTVF